MVSEYQELIDVYDLTSTEAAQVVQGLTEAPPVLPGIIYKQWVLQKLVGLSKEQATLYLCKWGYERENDE